MKDVKSRLLEFLKYLKMGQNAFESECEISNGYLSHLKSSIGSDILMKIHIKYPDLNISWIVTGEEEMLLGENSDNRIDLNRIIKSQQQTINRLTEILYKKEEEIEELRGKSVLQNGMSNAG